MSGKPEFIFRFASCANGHHGMERRWYGLDNDNSNGMGASPRSTVVCVEATPSRLCYMLIVVLEVKNVPTNHLLVPSSLRIESKKATSSTVEKVSIEFVAYQQSSHPQQRKANGRIIGGKECPDRIRCISILCVSARTKMQNTQNAK
jgi:hypothetical protein